MEKDLKWLISNSGDSKLISFEHEYPFITVKIELDDENSSLIEIKLKTLFSSFTMNAVSDSDSARTGFLNIHSLTELMMTQNGYYITGSEFKDFMELRRSGLYLAIGLKANEFPYILKFSGYGDLITCIVQSLGDITFRLL